MSSAVPGKRGRTHTGTICIPRLEEKVVSHAVYLVCTSVRHLFDGGGQHTVASADGGTPDAADLLGE